MTYSENETINPYELSDNVRGEINEFNSYNILQIMNDKNIDSIFLKNFQNEFIINPQNSENEEKDEKNIYFIQKLEDIKGKKEEKKDSIPSLYYFEDILSQNPNKDTDKKKLKGLFDEIDFVEKIQKVKTQIQFLEKKRKMPDYDNEYDFNLKELIEKKSKNISNNIDDKIIQKKRGRTPSNPKNTKTHDKMKPDNIIKKLKGKIFEYAILFLNKILNRTNDNDKLLNLNYKKYINRLNREEDLKYINMKLKDLFSNKISKKYSTKPVDFNKKLIKKILNKNSDETIKFAFNITLRDWLDLFTLKKRVEELLKESDKNIDCEKIKKSIYPVDAFINEIKHKNGKEYLTPFIFLLYNYERWFYIKRGRKISKKKQRKENKK